MLPELAGAKKEGLPLSVETCPHYLVFDAESIPDGDARCVWVRRRSRDHAAALRDSIPPPPPSPPPHHPHPPGSYKCAPPIRGAENRARLVAGVADGTVDSLASDHSPCDPALKGLERNDFMAAWGGVAGLQSVLPSSWHALSGGRGHMG